MPQKPKHDLPELQIDPVGKNIAKSRKKRGLTQTELAEKVGISQRLLSHYEVGRLQVSAEMIIRIALALSASTDEILGLKNNKQNKETDFTLLKRLRELENLPYTDQKKITDHIKDLSDKNKLKEAN